MAAKPKRSDIQSQIEALQAQLDQADTDDEVWVKDDNGREVKVSGRRATSILGRLGLLDDDGDDDDDAGDDDAGDDVDDDKKPAGGGYFNRRK